jgi:hypothetical protein
MPGAQAARWSGVRWLGSGPIGSPGWSYPYISRYAAMGAAFSVQCWRAAGSAGTGPRAVMAQVGEVWAVCSPSRRVRSSIRAAMPVR